MQHKGLQIEESESLVQSIDSEVASLFSSKYITEIKKQEKSNESLYLRMRLLVSARRSARMIVATRTTHESRPSQWLAMLKKVYLKVQIASLSFPFLR